MGLLDSSGSTHISAPRRLTELRFLASSRSRSLYAIARPSVVCDVRAPYSGGSIFRNISTALGTLAVDIH